MKRSYKTFKNGLVVSLGHHYTCCHQLTTSRFLISHFLILAVFGSQPLTNHFCDRVDKKSKSKQKQP